MNRMYKCLWVVIVGCCLAEGAFAKLTLPSVISSNMVLQQKQVCPVWGTAEPNEPVSVSFAGKTYATRADVLGRWAVSLEPMNACKTPQSLTVKGKEETLTLTNVVIGEVWLCSGQSNMQYSLKRYKTFAPPKKGTDLGAEELKKPVQPMLRVFLSDRAQSWDGWQVASGKSLPDITAAGYFFGKEIQRQLDVPVGIISAALGGQRIETWTPVEAYKQEPTFAKQLKRSQKVDGIEPGQWYNQMLVPLAPFAVKGFLWYQGENNCVVHERNYAAKYKLLTDCWRKTFRVPDAPFYSVLLAPHTYSKGTPRDGKKMSADELPLFWQQQLRGVKLVSNNGIVCITDLVDTPMDIHPPYKWEVGLRLARLALAKTYGLHTHTTVNGPELRTVAKRKKGLLLTFENCGTGLKSRDGQPLDWFEVAGKNGIFYKGNARIQKKNEVFVSSPDVKEPEKVRFAWNEDAMPNLVNSDGLPAFPFGTSGSSGRQ